MKKYYEMEVLIKGVVRVPVDDYDGNKDYAIEAVEISDDLINIAENIERNNDNEYFIFVNRANIKEIEA